MAEHFKEDDGLFLIPDEIDELDDTANLSAARDEIIVPDVPKYLLPNRVYDVLKWVAVALIPMVSWAFGELAPDYGIDPYKFTHALDVVGTVIAALIVGSEISARGR